MITADTRPGVSIERFDATAPAMASIRTDVAAFVGIAESGPLDTPVPVQSFRQFQSHFGGFTGAGYLAYAVRGFFENGGRRCWVARVACRDEGPGARASSLVVADAVGDTVWTISASSPGTWGDDLSVLLHEEFPAQTTADPALGTAQYSAVATVAGFARGDLAKLSQPGLPAVWRVVSHVDARNARLYWVHPEPGLGLPYDKAVTGLDPAQPVQVASLAYVLTVFRSGRLAGHYRGLRLVPEHPDYGPLALRAPEYDLLEMQNDFAKARKLPQAPRPVIIEGAEPSGGIPGPLVLPSGTTRLTGGADGLASLRAEDFIGEAADPLDGEEERSRKARGLACLEAVDEIALVAVPDILIRPASDPEYDEPEVPAANPCLPCPPPEPAGTLRQPLPQGDLPPVFSDDDIFRVQAALVERCETRGDRFALLDPPFGAAADDGLGLSAAQAWRAKFETRQAALYYPWLRVVDARGDGSLRALPACGHAAGQYAATDFSVGVHKAPANRVLEWVQDVTAPLDDARHGLLNGLGINAVRAEPGRGLRIMGARTLSSDPDWRYVNVRRLIMMIKKAVDISAQWAVFEPNHAATRAKLRLSLTVFLSTLWRKGALAGASPDEAFYVKCDAGNNPAAERANGKLVAEVGVAPSKPFEFVILRIGRQDNSLEIAEADGPEGGS